MGKHLLFTRKRSPQEKLKIFIEKYGLESSYCDNFEKIFGNESILLSVTKRVTWILIYDDSDSNLELDIKNFFNGG